MPRERSSFPPTASGDSPERPRSPVGRALRSYASSVRRLIFAPIAFVFRESPKILSAAMALLVPTILSGLALLLSPSRGAFLSGPAAPIRVILLWLAFLFFWSLALILLRSARSALSGFWERFEAIGPEDLDEDSDDDSASPDSKPDSSDSFGAPHARR